jgi:drug/metabolite transporter (DMT)-like permease
VSDLGLAVLAGAGGMIGWGSADFFAKQAVDQLGDLIPLFWSQLVGTLVLVSIALLGGDGLSLSPLLSLEIVGFGVVSGLSYLLLYRGFERGQISLLSPIFATYAGVVVLLSAGLFGEVIPGQRAIALCIILAGVVLLALDLSGVRSSLAARQTGGIPEVIGAMLIFALWLVLWDRFVHDRSWVPLLAAVRAVATLTLFVTARLQRTSLSVSNRQLWPVLGLIGLCDVAAFGLVSLGFSQTAYPSVVAMLSSAFSLPTLLLARWFLGERLARIQLLGVTVIVIGVVLTAGL